MQYTDKQIAELTLCASDPVHFIQTYVRPLDKNQTKYVQALHKGDLPVLALFDRGAGKTTVSLAFTLWLSLFSTYRVCVFASPTHQMSTFAHTKFDTMYIGVPKWMRSHVTHKSRDRFSFANGSSVKFAVVTESLCRGTTPSLLILDEFGTVKQNVAEAMSHVVPIVRGVGSRIAITGPKNDPGQMLKNIGKMLSHVRIVNG